MPINIMLHCGLGGPGTHWTRFVYGPAKCHPTNSVRALKERVRD